jgi:hypothetical protein
MEDDRLARGRARVERGAEGLEITIRAQREWFVVVFVVVWLSFWLYGGAHAVADLVTGRTGGDTPFLLVWLVAWAAATVLAFASLAWRLAGREIVALAPDELRVTRAVGPFRRTRRFARHRIARVRTDPWRGGRRSAWRSVQTGGDWLAVWGLGGGSVVFDYGARTHRFGIRLDEAESAQIAELLRRELGPAAAEDAPAQALT